jgi:hypothetical protein
MNDLALGPVRSFAALLGVCVGLVLAVPAKSQEISFAANDIDFLNLMGNLEGPRGFGTVSDFAPILPKKPLTEMTLVEVLDYQQDIRAAGTISSAVGRYQFIYVTLRDLVHKHAISGNLRFDGEVQTYLARFLMHKCGFFDPATPTSQLANCLASVWAALPLVSGPTRGKSAYAADGINKALTTPETVLHILEQRFQW